MSIGTDFERFLEDGRRVRSAEFLRLPDKFQSHVELRDADGLAGYIHRDNVMVEMCVAPQDTGEGLVKAVSRVLNAASDFVKQAAPEVVIGDRSSARFQYKDLQTPAARELGCDMDFVARDMDSVGRDPLNANKLGDERYAGGHLHFSWPNQGIPAWVGASICDLLIGLPEAQHLNHARAMYYGAGSLHRPTEYPDGSRGVEYRPLDCYWTTTQEHLERVARRADAVHKVLTEGSVNLVRGMVDRWQPLRTSFSTLVALYQDINVRDAQQWAADAFRKEFGYDPV